MDKSKTPRLLQGNAKQGSKMLRISESWHDRFCREQADHQATKRLLERMVMALEGTEVGAWEYNVPDGEVWFSESLMAIQGYSGEEGIRHPQYPDLFLSASLEKPSFVHPDDLPIISAYRQSVVEGRSLPAECEFRMKHKDGHWVWVSQRSKVIERAADGTPVRLVGLRTEVTERREAQERALMASHALVRAERQLQLAAEAANLGVWTWNVAAEQGFLSPNVQSVVGLPAKTPFDQATINQFLSPGDAKILRGQFEKVVSDDGRIETEFQATLANGSVRWVYCAGAVSESGPSGPATLSGILLDITDQKESAAQLAATRSELDDAQIRALRYQVNPHFLFNTLSSIATLIIDGSPEQAERMVLSLASFYRSSLERDPHQKITLAEEMRLQSLYLDVEQVRFPDELEVRTHIPENVEDALVPCLILQPLIENAIKYGLRSAGRKMTIEVKAQRSGGQLLLEVSDDGIGGSAQPGTGLGLRMTERRLASAFGQNFTVESGCRPEGGFQVRMCFPFEQLASIARLRKDHAALLSLCNQIGNIVSQHTPTSLHGLRRLREQLKQRLIAHLKAEDQILYPRLKSSDNLALAKLADQFSDEMGHLAGQYSAYEGRWDFHKIEEHWNSFCEDTKEIIASLAIRIEKEDHELFPLVELHAA